MTNLADRIHALTGADRAIDAEVAVLLHVKKDKHWKDDRDTTRASLPTISHGARLGDYEIHGFSGCQLRSSPAFTTSLDATVAEIERKGWFYGCTNYLNMSSPRVAKFNIWYAANEFVFTAKRSDHNLTLAALEALVRAVEAGE